MKPTIDAGLRDLLTGAAPTRVHKKLTADPEVAGGWTWSQDGPVWTVNTGAQTVRLAGETLTDAAQVTCDCLLSPRCLHVVAAIAVLDVIATAPAAEDSGASTSDDVPQEPAEPAHVKLTPRQREAAELAWRAGAALLAGGAARAGTPVRDAVVHAAETARKAKLPLLSTVATRVARALGDLAADSAAFQLSALTADVHQLLAVAARLRDPADGHAETADVGVARRGYTDHGGGTFTGLFAERILTDSGYAGVVTYLADADRRIWTVADVRPGGAERIHDAYRAAEWLPAPWELSRGGVYAAGLTMSADGRLGRAASADTARVPVADWRAPAIDPLWTEPLAAQIDRVLPALAADPTERRAGDDLVFVEAVIGELHPGALTVFVGDVPVALLTDRDEQPAIGNLRRLAAHVGATVRMILRVHPSLPRAAFPVAVGDCAALSLPDSWGSRANLTLDELPGVQRPADGAPAAFAPDPLDPVARLRGRTVLSGRPALRSASLPGSLAALRRHRMPTAALLLDRLAATANATVVRATGEYAPTPPDEFAAAWTACGVYEAAARRELMRRMWTAA